MNHTEHELQLAVAGWCFANRRSIVLPNFYRAWESDVWACDKRGESTEFEIKVTVADYRADIKKKVKHDALAGCLTTTPDEKTRIPAFFYYVMPAGLEQPVPEYAGLMVYHRPGHVVGFINSLASYVKVVKRAPRLHSHPVGQGALKLASVSLSCRWWRRELQELSAKQLTVIPPPSN